jgi:hypothetical protein
MLIILTISQPFLHAIVLGVSLTVTPLQLLFLAFLTIILSD